MPWCVRHAPAPGYTWDIHDVCATLALDEVDAAEVDAERAGTAPRDVGLLRRGRERLAVFLRLRPGREDLSDTEEPLADHIDLQVTPFGWVIALCEDGRRLVRGARLGEPLGLG